MNIISGAKYNIKLTYKEISEVLSINFTRWPSFEIWDVMTKANVAVGSTTLICKSANCVLTFRSHVRVTASA